MKKILLFSMSFFVLFYSCSKDESIEVILKQSGNISATLKQKNGNPISDEVVGLYTSNNLMQSKKTDANGNVNFGECIEGDYRLVVENIEVNNVTYFITQQVQAISGTSTNIELIPEDHVGTVTFKAIEKEVGDEGKYISSQLSGVTALIVSSDDYNLYSYDINELLSHAIAKGTTAENGEVEIENIPANQSFVIAYYHDKKEDWDKYNANIFSIRKNENFEAQVVYSYAVVSVNFHNYSTPVQGLNVLLVDNKDYWDSNSSITKLKTVAKQSSISDSEGNVVFSRVRMGEYTIIYYSDENDFNHKNIYVYDPVESFSYRVY